MNAYLPKLRKRIAKSERGYSACWALVEQPSLLIVKNQGGQWKVFCDRVYLMAEEPELPVHVLRSLRIESDLSEYKFLTRRDALQAIQMWIIRATDNA